MYEIKNLENGDGVILQLKGDFMSDNEVEKLQEAIDKITADKKKSLIIDFDRVTYFYSRAIGVIFWAYSNFVKRNAKLVVCNANNEIKNIFSITKLSSVVSVYDSIEEAQKAVNK